MAAPRRLRIGTGSALDNSFGVAAKTLSEDFTRRTDGRFSVDIYPDATLGNDEAMLAAVQAGTLDLTAVSSALLASYQPVVGLLDLPFLFKNREQARAALDGPEGQAIADLAKSSGVPVLAWGENGVRHLTGHRPFHTAADLRGVKLRVLPAPLLMNGFRAMGAAVDNVPFSQLYEALLTGRFEAQENPLQLVLSARLYEVQSHVTLTGHTYSAMAIVASPDLLEDLGAADRIALTEAAKLAAVRSREFGSRQDDTVTQTLQSKGMTIVTDLDRHSFLEAAAPAEAVAAEQFGADMIARLRAS